MIDIRQPKITGLSTEEQVSQMRSYLYQLSQQLQWAFSTIGTGGQQETTVVLQEQGGGNQKTALDTFAEIKGLIIKSADIVNAYSEIISRKLSGTYVAESDFGTFKEATQQTIEENSTGITNLFTNLQQISDTVDGLYDIQVGINAYVRTGSLYEKDGVPQYGLEIGQTNTVDGQTVFSKFARFTSDRLSFFDRNDTEIAYISDYKLYITNAEITGALTLTERFKIFYRNGLAFQWIGGGS